MSSGDSSMSSEPPSFNYLVWSMTAFMVIVTLIGLLIFLKMGTSMCKSCRPKTPAPPATAAVTPLKEVVVSAPAKA